MGEEAVVAGGMTRGQRAQGAQEVADRAPPEGQEGPLDRKELHVELVVDSAGKVRSVKPAGDTKFVEQYVRVSASRWKFIPAFRNDRSVASRMHTAISPLQ